jgi:hypothetical protein
MDEECKARIALSILDQTQVRYSGQTGEPVSHEDTQALRAKAIAFLDSIFG